MSQRNLYIIVGVLALAVIVLGYGWYSETRKTSVDIDIGNGGLSIKAN